MRFRHAQASASTIGGARERLDVPENSTDVPEVLGETGDLNDVRDELEADTELVGDHRHRRPSRCDSCRARRGGQLGVAPAETGNYML